MKLKQINEININKLKKRNNYLILDIKQSKEGKYYKLTLNNMGK